MHSMAPLKEMVCRFKNKHYSIETGAVIKQEKVIIYLKIVCHISPKNIFFINFA